MISREKFYGGSYGVTANTTLFRCGKRNIELLSGCSQITLPSRTNLPPGGPYWFLVNHSGGNVAVKNELGATILTAAQDTVTTVLLGTTKWVAVNRVINTPRVFQFGGNTRANPVGYIPDTTTVTIPTDYDDDLTCLGNYRRARNCADGTLSNLWMHVDDISSGQVFRYQWNCYTFFPQDKPRLSVGIGGTLVDTGSDGFQGWFDDCDLCNGWCDPDSQNPALPIGLIVDIAGDTDEVANMNGRHTFMRDGKDYIAWNTEANAGRSFYPSGCCYRTAKIVCTLLDGSSPHHPFGGWAFVVENNCTVCPGGAAVYIREYMYSMTAGLIPGNSYAGVDVTEAGGSPPTGAAGVTATVVGHIMAPEDSVWDA
jgi:hypothetical protein